MVLLQADVTANDAGGQGAAATLQIDRTAGRFCSSIPTARSGRNYRMMGYMKPGDEFAAHVGKIAAADGLA
jgi:hypothetical protein